MLPRTKKRINESSVQSTKPENKPREDNSYKFTKPNFISLNRMKCSGHGPYLTSRGHIWSKQNLPHCPSWPAVYEMSTAFPKGKQLAAGNSHLCGCHTATGHPAHRASSPCGPGKQPHMKITRVPLYPPQANGPHTSKHGTNLVPSASPSSLVFGLFGVNSLPVGLLNLSRHICRLGGKWIE